MNSFKNFEIRTYSLSELGQLYFPNIKKSSASIRLKRWINGTPVLLSKLNDLQYKSGQKLLTPKQVAIIIGHFGEP